MRILIAEDESITRRMLQATVCRYDHQVEAVSDGQAALEALVREEGPTLALLDWNMPQRTGPEVCQRVRAASLGHYTYLILLTSRSAAEDAVQGLHAGADDFVRKPCDPSELLARIRVGERILALEADLARKVAELQAEKAHVAALQCLLPICMHCRKIRDDGNNWKKLETYLTERTGSRLSHGLCADCLEAHYPEPD